MNIGSDAKAIKRAIDELKKVSYSNRMLHQYKNIIQLYRIINFYHIMNIISKKNTVITNVLSLYYTPQYYNILLILYTILQFIGISRFIIFMH